MEANCRFIRNERLWQLGPARRVEFLAAISKAKNYGNAVAGFGQESRRIHPQTSVVNIISPE
jgi:hypothetical protein